MGLCISGEWNHWIGFKEDWQLAISYNR